MPIKSIKHVKNLSGKRVLLRVDFNVPIKGAKVADDFKIRQSLPTIKYLLQAGAKVILVSHLGRPKGAENSLSLKPVAKTLERLLKKTVKLLKIKRLKDFKIVGERTQEMKDGEIVMLENIRFLSGEEKNKRKLAKNLAKLADLFVLDGFAVAHRAAASVSRVAKYLPAYAGLLLVSELENLTRVIEKPNKPLVVILGGAKVETKIPVLKNLLSQADHILIGGGILTNYLWAKGYKVASSLINKKYRRKILKYCSNKKVILPVDVVVGREDGREAKVQTVSSEFKVRNSKLAIYDIGPATVRLFAKYIKGASTLIWNGAMGRFEQHPYEYGTYATAQLFAARSSGRAFGVAGGGETVEVFDQLGLSGDIDFISTGGGAMLEFLSGKKLPGVEAVSGKKLEEKLYG